MMIERPKVLKFDLAEILSGFGGIYFVNALVAFIFAASAPVAIILTAGAVGGLSEADLASWLFGSFFINALISLAFCLIYRQPLVFFWTIPGTVLVGQALDHLSFAEVIGTYYATGLLMLVLGLTGWMRRFMNLVPMPIVMAMVAGVFLQFGLNLIFALRDGIWIAGPMTAVFILFSALPALGRRVPPMIATLIVGVIAVLVLGEFNPSGASTATIASPILYAPEFSWAAIVEMVIPLAITVLVAQNAQGFAVLETSGHKPPVDAVTAACGAGSMVAAMVGTVSTCLTGPVNAILASGGEREKHYVGGVIVALLGLAFGIFSPVVTRFMLATPKVFIAALAGLALVRVLERAFVISFQGSFTLGAAVAFLITVADVPIFSIGAPFWGLVIGFVVSWALERDDFRALKAS